MVNKPLIRPAISGGGTWPGGGRLTSHEIRPQTPTTNYIVVSPGWSQGIGKDVPRSQRTPENGKSRNISPIYPYSSWVFMGYYPQESLYKPYKYHGYTVRGTPNCPLINLW